MLHLSGPGALKRKKAWSVPSGDLQCSRKKIRVKRLYKEIPRALGALTDTLWGTSGRVLGGPQGDEELS